MLFAGILTRPWPRRLVRPRRPAGPRRSLRRRGRDHLWCRDRAGWPDVSFGWRLCRRHAAVGDGRARGSGVDRLARGACGGTRCRKHLELDARLRDPTCPHFAFAVLWLLAGGLALAWNSRVAAHLVAVARTSVVDRVCVSGPSLISGRRSCSPMAQPCCSAADSRLPLHLGRARRRPAPSCRPMARFRWRASRSWRRPWPTRSSAASAGDRGPAALDDLVWRRGRDPRLCRHRNDAPGRHGLRRGRDRARPCAAVVLWTPRAIG